VNWLRNPFEFGRSVLNKGLRRKAARERQAGNPHGEMTLVEHIIELRQHAVRSAYYFIGFFILTMIFMSPLVAFLRRPFEVYRESIGKDAQLMSTAVFEVIFMNFKICLIVALILGVPFFLLEVWRFVAPALYPGEKRMARPVLLASIFLFYAGISFGFYVIVPAFLSNALEWASEYANVVLTVENYFNSLATMVFVFGIIFEVPVIMSLLGLAGILKAEMVSKNRRVVLFLSVLVGALISPPDVFSLAVCAVPLYGMIELSVFALQMIEKRKAAEAQNESGRV
jgi:sec-independent protein translocase protein TatC